MTGAYVGAGLAGGAHGWVVGRAGFWDVLATWVSSSSPWGPDHPTSMCDSGVKHDLSNISESWFQKSHLNQVKLVK